MYARIYQEGGEANPLANSWPVNVVSVDTPYTFNLKKEVPLDSNQKYGVRFYRSDNSNAVKIGYHLYNYHKAEGGPYPNPGTDIAYGAWNDTGGKNLLRPALSVSWTAGIQHPDVSSFKTYQETVSSLSSDGYATTTYAVHNLSGVANITSMPLSSYEAISATADAETLYVITED